MNQLMALSFVHAVSLQIILKFCTTLILKHLNEQLHTAWHLLGLRASIVTHWSWLRLLVDLSLHE
jgi:hypothetical protein